jgi:hypothetical protein
VYNNFIKYFILGIFLCNTIIVFSQKDTLNNAIKLKEIVLLDSYKKKIASSILRDARNNIRYNYAFQKGVNYKVKSIFKNFKDSIDNNIDFLVSFKKLFSSKIKIIETRGNHKAKFNYLYQVMYANLKWAKKSNGNILSFKESYNYYLIETESKHQFNLFKINKKDYSFEKIIVTRNKKGEKEIDCENSRLELTFTKFKKIYEPKELRIKCYDDNDNIIITHNLSFLKVLPYKKIDNNNNNNIHRILRLYTDRNN